MRGLRETRRLIIFIIGITVVLFGIILIVTPGPASLVIPAGLAILSLEFAWARRLLRKVRRMVGLSSDETQRGTTNSQSGSSSEN